MTVVSSCKAHLKEIKYYNILGKQAFLLSKSGTDKTSLFHHVMTERNLSFQGNRFESHQLENKQKAHPKTQTNIIKLKEMKD